MTKRTAVWWLVAFLLVGAWLRLPNLPDAPPGIHYDEAANGILAGDIGLRAERPVFISSYTGKEVLFFYVAGGLMSVLGESVFALRFASACLGLLTIAATYRMMREIWPQSRTVAVVTAALIATSFWHVLFSRLGFRAISQPLLQALTILFLWRACRSVEQNKVRWGVVIAAGICLGLTAYTYLAARLFPVLLSVAGLPLLWQWKRYWRPLVGTAVVGTITLAPLGRYFVANPDSFWVRISQVAPTEASLTLSESLSRSFAMFVWSGDPYWRFNLPGKPLLEIWWAVFAFIGLGMVLWHWQRDRTPLARAGRLLLLVAPVIMLLPTALATSEIVPSNLRAIGLLPFVLFFPALGLSLLLKRVPPIVTPLALGVILLGQGGLTYNNYFQDWATRADLFYENDSDLTAVAEYLDRYEGIDREAVYVAAPFAQHPTVAFASEQYDQIKWLIEGNALVVPAEGAVSYLFPHNAPADDWTQSILAQAIVEEGELGPDGEPLFTHYQLNETAVPRPQILLEENFGFAVTLLGYDVQAGRSGDTIPLTLYWRIDGVPQTAWRPFVHVEDRLGYRWGQIEPEAYITSDWAVGETVVQRVDVPIRDGAPPSDYRLKVGFFDVTSQQAIARFDGNGRYAGTHFSIDNVQVARGELPRVIPTAPRPLTRPILPDLEIIGYETPYNAIGTGEPFDVALWWLAATERTLPDLQVRYELYNEQNVGKILRTDGPVRGSYPFSTWETAQFVIDRTRLEVPLDLPAGSYRLQARVLSEIDETLEEIDLGQIDVVASERLFAVPELAMPTEATFGGEIALRGYEVTADDEENLLLTLAWQALERPLTDYTVFVHVLDGNGRCCVWQLDAMPQQGGKRTALWLNDEVVLDQYMIVWPEETAVGEYELEIGLYIAESGQRLSVESDLPHTPDALFLRPLRKE